MKVKFCPDLSFDFILGESYIFDPDGDLLGLSYDSGDNYFFIPLSNSMV